MLSVFLRELVQVLCGSAGLVFSNQRYKSASGMRIFSFSFPISSAAIFVLTRKVNLKRILI